MVCVRVAGSKATFEGQRFGDPSVSVRVSFNLSKGGRLRVGPPGAVGPRNAAPLGTRRGRTET